MKHQGRAVSNIQLKQYVAILNTNINQRGRWAYQPKRGSALAQAQNWLESFRPPRPSRFCHTVERGPDKQ